MKSKGNTKIFEIPKYQFSSNDTFDIWGGTQKPVKKLYMTVTNEKYTIVNFFDNKTEAINFSK